MKITVKCICMLCVLWSISAAVTADDLALLDIKNSFQLNVVKQILSDAYTKTGDRFLVSLDEAQKDLLTRSGIDFEVVLGDVDPSELFLIRPSDRPDDSHYDLAKLAGVVELGAGLSVGSLSTAEVRSLSEQTGFTMTPLSDLSVRFHYLPPAVAGVLQALDDFPTDTIINLVSQDSVYAFNTRLENFRTRYIWTDSIDAARDWLAAKFLSYGYTVTTPTFWYGGDYHYNVMAVKEGYAEPDKVIVIGGHYDSITYGQTPGPFEFAPGSDDDGSGVALTLELARIFADIPTRKTIIFMPFSAEEVGLVGSHAAAQDFVNAGTELEVMMNFDMVGYTPEPGPGPWAINLSCGPNTAYRQVMIDAGNRLTGLIPTNGSYSGNSDHASFNSQGYNIVNAIEGIFNQAGWHTNLDLTSRMNFYYLTEVVRMAAATMAIVANAAHPTEIERIVDMGDGQALEIFWTDCDPNYDYTLYYGTLPGVYDDSVLIPQGECSYVVDGLTDGTLYYFSVFGAVADGYPAVYSVEASETPYLLPRAPASLTAEPDLNMIRLDWGDNPEADLNHYRLYRDDGSGFNLIADNLTTSEYVDADVQGQIGYIYRLTAIDNTLYESPFSAQVLAYAATFDGGILLVDETGTNPPLPTQPQQLVFFEELMDGTPYSLTTIDAAASPITRNVLGRYSPILWIDDDLSNKLAKNSEDTLMWYAGYSTDILMAGFRIVSFWSGPNVPIDHILYQEFGVAEYRENIAFDFVGADGKLGWPDIQVDPGNPLGNLPYIPKLVPRSGAQVIYTYDSFTDDPTYEGQPCAIMYSAPTGQRIILGFPLYFLTDASAQALIDHAISALGQAGYEPGDVDGSGIVDIVDLVILVDYMFLNGPAPTVINSADVDGNCQIDIADLLKMVDYLFFVGEDLYPGCVN